MSQFAFLKSEFTPVYEHAQRAEVLALSDPRGSLLLYPTRAGNGSQMDVPA